MHGLHVLFLSLWCSEYASNWMLKCFNFLYGYTKWLMNTRSDQYHVYMFTMLFPGWKETTNGQPRPSGEVKQIGNTPCTTCCLQTDNLKGSHPDFLTKWCVPPLYCLWVRWGGWNGAWTSCQTWPWATSRGCWKSAQTKVKILIN